MKKLKFLFVAVCLIFSVSSFVYCHNLTIVDLDYDYQSFKTGVMKDDIIYGLATIEGNKTRYFSSSTVYAFNTGNMTVSELSYKSPDDASNSLLTNSDSKMAIDSIGNLWVSGNKLYMHNGSEWKEFYIDDEYKDIRQYVALCVDIYNNVWVGTSTFIQEDGSAGVVYSFSELLKFDGTKLYEMMRFETGVTFLRTSVIYAMPDGNVIFQRTFNKTEEDLEAVNTSEIIYIINQAGEYTSRDILRPEYDEYGDWANILSFIFPISAENIWYGFDSRMAYLDGIDDYEPCCSGLVHYSNGEYYLFDDESGYPRYGYPNYAMGKGLLMPPISILPHHNETYLVFLEQYILQLNYREVLNIFDYSEILNNSIMMKSEHQDTERLISLLFRLLPANGFKPLPFCTFGFNTNGELCFLNPQGVVLVYKGNQFTSVKENVETEDLLIYPNPVKDYLYVNNESVKYFRIIDIAGRVIKEGKIDKNEIYIEHLATGTYIVQLTDGFKFSKSIKFIKE